MITLVKVTKLIDCYFCEKFKFYCFNRKLKSKFILDQNILNLLLIKGSIT